jgi:hypothetical protein
MQRELILSQLIYQAAYNFGKHKSTTSIDHKYDVPSISCGRMPDGAPASALPNSAADMSTSVAASRTNARALDVATLSVEIVAVASPVTVPSSCAASGADSVASIQVSAISALVAVADTRQGADRAQRIRANSVTRDGQR